MKEVEQQAHEPDGQECPKRIWVMTALSDDDTLDESGELPQGLRFHLSRCESCRALADRLLKTSEMLHELSAFEPGEDLAARANEQALAALRDGARLTGRVAILDEPELIRSGPVRVGWHRYVRYAVAASIFLAIGLFGLWALRRPLSPQIADVAKPTPSDTIAPPMAPEPVELADGSREQSEASRQLTIAENVTFAEDEPTREGRPRRPCRYRSHVEAAMCDDTNCVHRAVILPRRRSPTPRATRELGRLLSVFEGFDSSPSSRSTKSRNKE